jgi:hypothetical protein
MAKPICDLNWETYQALSFQEKMAYLMQSGGTPYHTLFEDRCLA